MKKSNKTKNGEKNNTILHIAPTPFFADRGCHIRIRNEIEALSPHPYTITLCTYHLGRDIDSIDTRRIWRIPGYNKLDAGYSPFRFIADFFLFFLVLKTCWQERPALLHCHLHEGALIGWAVKWCLFWRKLPVIMDMQGSLSGELAAYDAFAFLPFLLRFFKRVERYICKMPDFFLCSSRQSQLCLINDFLVAPKKILLVQDVVPDAVFAAVSGGSNHLKDNIPADKQVILYTGSLLPGKGVQHLLQAMKELCSRRDDLFFILVGYPLDTAGQYVKTHNLEQYCLLPGQVHYSDLSDWLSLGDIAVEPKESDSGEASGKLLHYMAAGLPVVCFATDNNRDILGSSGYFAQTCDGQGLATGIEEALADMQQARNRGKQGQKRVRDKYSSSAVGQKLHDVYTGFFPAAV